LGMALSLAFRRHVLTGLALALLAAATADPAFAARRHRASPAISHRGVVRMPASPTDPDKDAALVVDGATGTQGRQIGEIVKQKVAMQTWPIDGKRQQHECWQCEQLY